MFEHRPANGQQDRRRYQQEPSVHQFALSACCGILGIRRAWARGEWVGFCPNLSNRQARKSARDAFAACLRPQGFCWRQAGVPGGNRDTRRRGCRWAATSSRLSFALGPGRALLNPPAAVAGRHMLFVTTAHSLPPGLLPPAVHALSTPRRRCQDCRRHTPKNGPCTTGPMPTGDSRPISRLAGCHEQPLRPAIAVLTHHDRQEIAPGHGSGRDWHRPPG